MGNSLPQNPLCDEASASPRLPRSPVETKNRAKEAPRARTGLRLSHAVGEARADGVCERRGLRELAGHAMSSSENSLPQSPLCGEATASPRPPRYAVETKNRAEGLRGLAPVFASPTQWGRREQTESASGGGSGSMTGHASSAYDSHSPKAPFARR